MAPTPKMTAEEAAECLANRHSGNEYLNELDEACEVAIARLRANCGTCQHWSRNPDPLDGHHYCDSPLMGHAFHEGMPADGSGYCHEHTPKARQT